MVNESVGKSKRLVKIFPIPFALGEIQENLIIPTQIPVKKSKEQIINKAFKLHSRGKISEAAKCFKDSINLGVLDYRVFSNYGGILNELGQHKEAEFYTRKALELKPDYEMGFLNLGNIFKNHGNLKEAELHTRKAIKLNPNYAEAYSNLGIILKELSQLKEAEFYTRKALQLKPDLAEANNNLGLILNVLGKKEEAYLPLKKAASIKPHSSLINFNLALNLLERGKLRESIDILEKSLLHNPNNEKIRAEIISTASKLSELDIVEKYSTNISTLGTKKLACDPMKLLHLEDNPKSHFKRAINFYKERYKGNAEKISFVKKEKIHIGYFSADFNAHPVMYLISRIIELHDDKYQVYLYSFGIKDDEYTDYIKEKVYCFRNIKNSSNLESSKIARNDKLDIAIDLMGYTKNNRMAIFSNRVAPIQINFLGYPSTSGSDQIDYLIGDKIVIPEEYKKYYSEKILYMPNCFMPFNNQRRISLGSFKRLDFNLPKEAIVLAAFHKNKKITIREIESWSRILHEIPNSILWISEMDKTSKVNLLKHFKTHRIYSDKIRFAKRMNTVEEHLSRHDCADIFLDTFNYNAHSTAIDSLWAELPVVTMMGKSFAARVGGSLLLNLGLKELIANSIKEYEEIVINLGKNSKKIKSIKEKIKSRKMNSEIFNTIKFTRDLERLYSKLIQTEVENI